MSLHALSMSLDYRLKYLCQKTSGSLKHVL